MCGYIPCHMHWVKSRRENKLLTEGGLCTLGIFVWIKFYDKHYYFDNRSTAKMTFYKGFMEQERWCISPSRLVCCPWGQWVEFPLALSLPGLFPDLTLDVCTRVLDRCQQWQRWQAQSHICSITSSSSLLFQSLRWELPSLIYTMQESKVLVSVIVEGWKTSW